MVQRFENLTYISLEKFTDLDTILITNTHTQLKNLPSKVLEKTKLIIHPNSGYDHFTDEYELWKNIPLVVGHKIRAQAVAEYSLAAVFEGLVELPQHLSWNKERIWNRRLLKGTPVWIFGAGHIGQIIESTLTAIGMNVTVVDPFLNRGLRDWRDGDIKKARVIIAACSLNQTSHSMFNQDFFSALGDEVLFINGARGKLVEEEALKKYLTENPKSFAFLDVFSEEPFSNSWSGFPQVWKTSHIAGVEKDLDQKIIHFEEEVLKNYLSLPEKDFFSVYNKELLQNKWIKGVLV